MKTAVVVLSDPRAGEEALGRVFNALAFAYDLAQRREEVRILFQGAGTRWAPLLVARDHPVHALYEAVKDRVVGVSHACAVAFGAEEEARKSGFALVAGNAVPGTAGLPSLAEYAADGFAVQIF